MSVICFSSLKGGVGKTTLSIGIARAFAKRGCETLIIDLDPSRHATRFLCQMAGRSELVNMESPLTRLFLNSNIESLKKENGGIVEAAMSLELAPIYEISSSINLIPSGSNLKQFYWGKAASIFSLYFPKLIDELHSSYDYIIIDTSPDFNILTRLSISVSDISVVPVDTSAMSICGLEELISNASGLKCPCWAIARTMVNKTASTVQKLSTDRLQKNLNVQCNSEFSHSNDYSEMDFNNPEEFFAMLEEQHQETNKHNNTNSSYEPEVPIYLLNSIINRSEQQNKLTFLGKTVFDIPSLSALAAQYSAVARELEQILSYVAEKKKTNSDCISQQLLTVSG